MNKKNKVLLASIGLAFLSGLAAISSTFAWFYTARTASLSYSSAKVVTEDNSLIVEYKSSLNTVMVDNTVDDNEIILDGLNEITDVSSDGLTFYKPVWNAFDTESDRKANSIPVVGAANADGYYIDFTITISREDVGSGGMKVYLGPQTLLSAVTDADQDQQDKNNAALLASRLAVINNGAVVLVYSPIAEAGGHTYITSADPGTKLYTVDERTTANNSTTYVTSFTEYTDATTATLPIADLTGQTTSVDVTFRAWLEGEDTHAVNDAIGGLFDIHLSLYGLTV